ncbi:glycoside hydrolase family 28 protein [Bacteroides sp. OttesenSCG-928-D19]|nr:glycoside hydrolase family 28 protein [Bacteroides sp. OttesenSCG-928-D19]
MRKIFSVLLLGFISVFTVSLRANNPWEEAEKIVASIKKTSFPDRTFNIIDYGAKPGDSTAVYHEEINRAIVECSLSGGGTVLVPKGVFYCGPITMKSHVNLHLEEGAELRFNPDRFLYFPSVLTRWEGLDCYNARPLIYAYGETNIAITGKGVIDGQAGYDNWWVMKGRSPETAITQNAARARLLEDAENFVPYHKRVMGPQDGLRPQLINFHSCRTVLIAGVTLKNSPFWVIHPLLCQDVIVSGVHIDSHGPNSDGCDPESSKNVLIENCFFNTGDDCIAIKSGRNADGRKWNVPSENIVVRKCEMRNGHGGVVIGSEISGGYRNLYVEDCKMDSPHLDRVIRIKTNNCRGGVIENVYVRNVEVGECKEAVLRINLLYEAKENCDHSFPPTVRNINLENVTCGKSRYGVLLIGYEDTNNISDIRITNCKFDHVEQPFSIKGTQGFVHKDLYINGKLMK